MTVSGFFSVIPVRVVEIEGNQYLVAGRGTDLSALAIAYDDTSRSGLWRLSDASPWLHQKRPVLIKGALHPNGHVIRLFPSYRRSWYVRENDHLTIRGPLGDREGSP